MGFNPYPLFTTAASGSEATLIPFYDPANSKIYVTVCGAAGEGPKLITKNMHPTASEQYIVGFCLLVFEGGASAGVGLG